MKLKFYIFKEIIYKTKFTKITRYKNNKKNLNFQYNLIWSHNKKKKPKCEK